MSEEKRYLAVVKFYNEQRAFGFAFCEEINDDVFIHRSNFRSIISPREQDMINFVLDKSDRGYMGKDIILGGIK